MVESWQRAGLLIDVIEPKPVTVDQLELVHSPDYVDDVFALRRASYSGGGGYCTFNGLMVAAVVLQREGLVERVGIIDCDHHWGDGTSDIIETLGAEGWIRHFSAGAEFVEPSDAAGFFARLGQEVEAMSDCDLVLYQAGADPHIHDPLGGFLTTEELRLRDSIVFRGLARLGVPVAWNLAGGYQQEDDGSIPAVLGIHMNTARESLSAGPPPTTGS